MEKKRIDYFRTQYEKCYDNSGGKKHFHCMDTILAKRVL